MLGPNATSGAGSYDMHHRQPEFRWIMSSLKAEMWRLAPGYRVLFLTGSGTLGLEATLYTLSQVLGVQLAVHRPSGHFAGRLAALVRSYGRSPAGLTGLHGIPESVVWVQYETAESVRVPDPEAPGYRVVDAVSAWPYYPLPDRVDAWVTVSGKQLGCPPGLAIVGLSEALAKALEDEPGPSYLDLRKWVRASMTDEVPHTPAIGTLFCLWDRLRHFNPEIHRTLLDSRRARLIEALPRDSVIGEGPVLSIRTGVLCADFIGKHRIYSRAGYPQIFLWSPTQREFDAFVVDVEAECGRLSYK